jgi:hypothetical protein
MWNDGGEMMGEKELLDHWNYDKIRKYAKKW